MRGVNTPTTECPFQYPYMLYGYALAFNRSLGTAGYTVRQKRSGGMLALRRNRWSVGPWLGETVLEVFGVICPYFVVFSPIFERVITDNPALMYMLGSAPEIIAVSFALITLVSKGSRLVRLWNYRSSSTPPFAAKAEG